MSPIRLVLCLACCPGPIVAQVLRTAVAPWHATADLGVDVVRDSPWSGVRWDGRMSGTFDRTAGLPFAGESRFRFGLRSGSGVGLAAGTAAVVTIPGQDVALGGFVSARVMVGRLELTGEIGRLLSVAGSPGTPFRSGVGADTGVRVGRGVRSLFHGQIGGRFERDWLHLSGRLIRRTRLTPYDGLGWEMSVGVEPLPGAMFRITGARAPIGASVYLPFRRALTFAVELVPRRPAAPVPPPPAVDRFATPGAGFTWSDGPGGVRLQFRHPGARSVELAGDFSDWRPVPMAPAGPDLWTITLSLAPGVHLVNLRVDGGAFQVPPGLEGADDGFGGRAGVLVVRGTPH